MNSTDPFSGRTLCLPRRCLLILSRKTLTANQIKFINQIIDYLTQNGVMDAGLLYHPPFTDYATAGLDGIFKDNDANGIVSVLDSIRKAAVA
jgi:type I restriction enzyme, R subunit